LDLSEAAIRFRGQYAYIGAAVTGPTGANRAAEAVSPGLDGLCLYLNDPSAYFEPQKD
jgi:hypothetical protein